jgi:hypothetical protein
MNQKQAERIGYERGYEAADILCGERPSKLDLVEVLGQFRAKEIGSDLRKLTKDEYGELLSHMAWVSEGNSRQFSPFEFTAHDLNVDPDRSEGLWDAFDSGVAQGIKAGVRKCLKRWDWRRTRPW